MTMFSIKQIFIYQLIIGRNSTKCYNWYQKSTVPNIFFHLFYNFVFDLFSLYFTESVDDAKNIPCPRKDSVIIIDFLSLFVLIFHQFLSFCISGKVQKVQQLIRWEHFGITFLARLISYNCSQLWAAISRTCKQEQSKTYIKAYS